jgi:hypothetical protein
MWTDGEFFVDFQSTDDETLDGELILFEDRGAHPLESIQDTCRRYRVKARLFRPPGTFVGELKADGNFRA